MSFTLTQLKNGWQTDQAIINEDSRVVIIRFGHVWDPTCMQMDETLARIAEKVKKFAVIYAVDVDNVQDLIELYELYEPCAVMFFYKNQHIKVDCGTGNNNKIDWAINDEQELIDIVDVVYRGASKGKGLVVAPRDYSTSHRY
ncbi:thioredoxin-like protein 4A-like protein [Ramicandelaber brevisporus]|nr:thioredoxin-like protein 4A-like protein [Ramicandelaber brevisporus]KAI8868358.1 thioredoxin-like protein 4A-like protein [Ramicandelaber brevisporus]